MKEKLEKLLKNSYCKYSKYAVACICIMKDNQEIYGVNVENASFGATICAERNAITTAISYGYQKDDFKEIHIMVNSDKIGTPCFMCRQVITEFMDGNTPVYLYSKTDTAKYLVKDLCPYPFSEDNL